MASLSRLGNVPVYSIYVLCLLLITYLFNQLDRYILAICAQPIAQDIEYGDKSCLPRMNIPKNITGSIICSNIKDADVCSKTMGTDGVTSVCYYDYNGGGTQYQLLVGPIFIVIYTFTGILLGYIADISNRKNMLGICLAIWSGMTVLTGFATEYWQLALLRFGLGIGEAGCTPFASSLIADYFAPDTRGTALGVYNLGIYTGYSLSYAFGDFITKADILGQGWRWTFWIAGLPGLLLAAIIFISMKEPERKDIVQDKSQRINSYNELTMTKKLLAVLKCFLSPSLLMLCFAGSIRNGAGYVWAYNTQPFFTEYYPEVSTGKWFSWIPLLGGSIGVIFGGFISDQFVKTRGPIARLWILIASLMAAAPFAAATLLTPPPYAFLLQIPTYIFGEMWVGVTLAVVIELVPVHLRASSVGFYFFIITNIGGNMPLLVTPFTNAFDLRWALVILYPGCYVLGALLFLPTMLLVKRDIRQVKQSDNDRSLLNEDTEHGQEKVE